MSTSGERVGEHIWPVAWGWWALVGAAWAVGIVGVLTIGLPFLAVGLAMAVVGVRWRRLHNRSASMVLVGAAAAPLLVAWFNRAGPGRACTVQGDVTSCSDQWSPWPFVVVALLFVGTGVLLARRSEPWSRRTGHVARG